MVSLSPKIEIINHFDNLIQRIDIDIDQCIKEYKENQILGRLDCFRVKKRNVLIDYNRIVEIEYFDSNESSDNKKFETVNEWSESTKVIDYLNQVRQKTIVELRKAQEDSLEHLKSKSCDLNHIKESKDVEEMKSRLFADKFYFQVLYKPFEKRISWFFSLFTIVADFYLSPSDISILENMINSSTYQLKIIDSCYSALVFDEKCAFIYGIFEEFRKQLKTQQYLSHLISFRQQDLLNIKSIYVRLKHLDRAIFKSSSNYLSKLESLELNQNYYQLDRVSIEGLSSLKSLSLDLESIEGSSFGNLNSLKKLTLDVKSEINNDMLIKLLEICPNIEELCLSGKFSNINLDCFTNLKKLRLSGVLSADFNFDLLKNICNQLEELTIGFEIKDNEKITKLLCHYFPNLSVLFFQDSTSLIRLIIRCQSLRIGPFEDLNSMKRVDLNIASEINNDMLTKLFKICPIVEKFCLSARAFNINFNNKKLSLDGNLFDDFNLDIIKNICNQLEKLSIKFENLDDESISKLLCRHNLRNIKTLEIGNSKITRLDKNLFDGFQMLHSLDISRNKELKIIEKDAFTNLKNLKKLSLSFNQLSELDPEIFSCFKNLIKLNLRDNNLTYFDLKIMDYIVNIKKIDLENNPKLVNKEEILNRFEQIKIN